MPTPDYTRKQWLRLGSMMPLARLADPVEIADAVLYLAGARSVTGQTIFVDGGAHLESYARDFVYLER
jgi:NAD(P)-dependent dehydrogenase (short-subunit alcohol dehydrogenase family)